MKGSRIISAYHARRVASLMARVLPLHQMVLGVLFEGMALVDEALPPSVVVQRIKEAMEPSKDTAGVVLDFVFPVSGHPPMRPEPGFIDFVSFLSPYSFFTRISNPLKLTLGWWDQPRPLFFKESPAPLSKDRTLVKANRITAEWDKKMRELRKKKLLWKQQAHD